MKLLISGSSGFIGTKLYSFLQEKGDELFTLGLSKKHDMTFQGYRPQLDHALLENLEGVIHLSGENIGTGRWTQSKKRKIEESRIQTTKALVTHLIEQNLLPSVFICASAVGVYGDHGAEIVDETTPSNSGLFLTEVCQKWEACTTPLIEKGVRVIHARFGMVLHPSGGALQQMLPLFQKGFGVSFAPGTQYLSWIHRNDLVAALDFILRNHTLQGAVNCSSPNPIPFDEFADKLAKHFQKKLLGKFNKMLIKILFGQKGLELFVPSMRVIPKKLLDQGFKFQFPTIEDVFQDIQT